MRVNLFTSSFKKKPLIWIKLIVFIIILLVILNYIGNHFEYLSNKNQSSTYAKQVLNTFYHDAKEVDLIFLGSSHSYCTFDPEYFDKNTDLYSYQLGTPLQHPDTSYYMMKEVLNYKKPKVMVFEIYWDMLDDEFESKQSDMLLSALKNEDLKKEYIKDVFPFNEKIKYYFKPVRYQQDAFAYYNKQLTDFVNKHKVDKNIEKQIGIEYYKDRGFLYTNKIIINEEFGKTNQFKNIDGHNWNMDKVQKEYIIKLKKLCYDNNIKIYFVTAPIANVSMEYIKNYNSIHDKISDFAKELNIKYIDYNIINKEENLLKEENFYDDAHLNNTGAVIVQEHFINWLKLNNGL